MKKYFAKQWFKIILLPVFVFSGYAQEKDYVYPPNSLQVIESISFKDTDIKDVIRAIAYEYKTNVTVDNKLNNRISVSLHKLSVYDALKIIALDNNCVFHTDSMRFVISSEIPKQIAPPPPPAEPEPEIVFYPGNNKIDMILRQVTLEKFVDKLRETTHKNYLIASGTTGKLSGALYKVDLYSGLKNILLNNGFYPQIKDSIIYITKTSYYSSLDEPGKQNKSRYWVSAQNKSVSIDVTDADLIKVVDDISNQLNLQVVKLTTPNSKVTVKCENMPLEKAFYYLFKGSEFTFKNDEGTYIIGKSDNNILNTTELVKLSHLRADKILEKLPKKLTEKLVANISIEHNAIIITGAMEEVRNFISYISTLDKPVPQVMIEALVVDYNLDNLFQFGIEGGIGDSAKLSRPDKWLPGIDVTASGKKINSLLKDIGDFDIFGTNVNVGNLGKLPDDFYLNIKALESNGIANIKSRPILSTLNGHTASLKIGTVQNYVFNEILPVTNQLSSTFIERETIQKIEANISFEITPWVGPNDQLTIEIKPDFQTPVGAFSPDKRVIPAINTRTLESTVKLKDGETIILGGLIQETTTNTETKVPFFGDIPLLGALFTSTDEQKSKGELIIYITPRIFYEDEFGYAYYDYGDE